MNIISTCTPYPTTGGDPCQYIREAPQHQDNNTMQPSKPNIKHLHVTQQAASKAHEPQGTTPKCMIHCKNPMKTIPQPKL